PDRPHGTPHESSDPADDHDPAEGGRRARGAEELLLQGAAEQLPEVVEADPVDAESTSDELDVGEAEVERDEERKDREGEDEPDRRPDERGADEPLRPRGHPRRDPRARTGRLGRPVRARCFRRHFWMFRLPAYAARCLSRPTLSVIWFQPSVICFMVWSRLCSPARNCASAVSRTTPSYWELFGTRRSRIMFGLWRLC